MTLRVPKDLTMVATGQLINESKGGDYSVTLRKSEVPLTVAGFNYGRFKKSAVQDQGLKYTIETYANTQIPDFLKQIQRIANESPDFAMGNLSTVRLMDKARAEAQLSLQIYSNMFGQLPYGRIAMTQQPYPVFGQAWPMLIYMPLTAFLDSTQRHQLGLTRAADFFKYVAAHEVAHQWWGHIIGWKSYRDQWMSEGFAEFAASIFAQAVYKNDKFVEFWKDAREAITAKNPQGKRPSDVGSVYMGYRLDTAKTDYVTRSMIYPKGAFILHMLRMMMWDPKAGDKRFSAMMKDLVKTYYNQNISTHDFQRIVEKHMTEEMDLDGNGKMDWFFNQWVYGTAIPNYKLEYKLEPAEGGKTLLVGKVTQSGVDGSFKMRVPVYLDLGGGQIRRLGVVTLYGNSSQDFRVQLPIKPKRVLLCAYEDVLCTIDL
jgi:hypothetical protein